MTLMEKLRELFGDKLDSEIVIKDDTGGDKDGAGKEDKTGDETKNTGDTGGTKHTGDGNSGGNNGTVDTVKGGDVDMKILEDGWYNSETGEIDVKKVKDETVLSALSMLNNNIADTKNKFTVDNAISDAINGLQLTISNDMFRKLVDTTGVKVTDGKVVGLTEAIDNVKTAEPSIFKGETQKTENNPLNKGFDPITKTNDSPSTWTEAFAMQESVQ